MVTMEAFDEYDHLEDEMVTEAASVLSSSSRTMWETISALPLLRPPLLAERKRLCRLMSC